MATVTKSGNNILITSTGTQDDELVLSDFADGRYTACIEVTAGDFQFNVGDVCSADNGTWTTDDKVTPFSFGTGLGKIYYKASDTNKTFIIGVV